MTIERLAEAADADEAKAFDKIRARFVEEAAKHMDNGEGIAAVAAEPDRWFWHLMELAVLAKRTGKPSPFPWFERFAARLLDEDDGTRTPPADPVAH